MPWNILFRGRQIPLTAVLGGIGTFAAWISVLALHVDARYVGTGWMIIGLAGYVIYRRRQGLDLRSHHRIARHERPASFVELDYRSAIVPIFGTDVDASRAARGGQAGGGGRESSRRSTCCACPTSSRCDVRARGGGAARAERARERQARGPQGRGEGAHAPDPHPQPRRRDRRGGGAPRVPRSSIWGRRTRRRPSGRSGPTASYLLAHRPCRVVIETGPGRLRPAGTPMLAARTRAGTARGRGRARAGQRGGASRWRRGAGRRRWLSRRSGSRRRGRCGCTAGPPAGSILRRRLAMCARSTWVSSL